MRIICATKIRDRKKASSFTPFFISCLMGGGFNEIKILNHLPVLSSRMSHLNKKKAKLRCHHTGVWSAGIPLSLNSNIIL